MRCRSNCFNRRSIRCSRRRRAENLVDSRTGVQRRAVRRFRVSSPDLWEWMGSGGLHGLQIRWRAPFGVRGGFDSLALPPPKAVTVRCLLRTTAVARVGDAAAAFSTVRTCPSGVREGSRLRARPPFSTLCEGTRSTTRDRVHKPRCCSMTSSGTKARLRLSTGRSVRGDLGRVDRIAV